MTPTKRKCAQPESSRTTSSRFGERNSRGSLRPKSFGVLGTDGICRQINFYSWLLIGFECRRTHRGSKRRNQIELVGLSRRLLVFGFQLACCSFLSSAILNKPETKNPTLCCPRKMGDHSLGHIPRSGALSGPIRLRSGDLVRELRQCTRRS
jgi:hypothetical protein